MKTLSRHLRRIGSAIAVVIAASVWMEGSAVAAGSVKGCCVKKACSLCCCPPVWVADLAIPASGPGASLPCECRPAAPVAPVPTDDAPAAHQRSNADLAAIVAPAARAFISTPGRSRLASRSTGSIDPPPLLTVRLLI